MPPVYVDPPAIVEKYPAPFFGIGDESLEKQKNKETEMKNAENGEQKQKLKGEQPDK